MTTGRQKFWTLGGTIAGRLFWFARASAAPLWALESRQFVAAKNLLD